MKSLLSVSLLLILLLCSSCCPTKGYRKCGEAKLISSPLPAMLGQSAGLEKFNMKIDFMKKHFSGMLIVKQMREKEYRVVFTSHFGLSIFDFTFTDRDFTVNHCLEALNKEKIITIFKNDFRLLFLLNLTPETEATRYCGKDAEGKHLFRIWTSGVEGYYFEEGDPVRLSRILAGKGFGKTEIVCVRTEQAMRESIVVRHPRIGLCIELENM